MRRPEPAGLIIIMRAFTYNGKGRNKKNSIWLGCCFSRVSHSLLSIVKKENYWGLRAEAHQFSLSKTSNTFLVYRKFADSQKQRKRKGAKRVESSLLLWLWLHAVLWCLVDFKSIVPVMVLGLMGLCLHSFTIIPKLENRIEKYTQSAWR